MSNFLIVSDATCDLPESYAQQHNLHIIPMSYLVDGEDYHGTLTLHDFYDKMRAGSMTTTSQITPAQFVDYFSDLFERYDEDILYLGFSSALSGTVSNAAVAAGMLKESYPNRTLHVVDSYAAALGEGLFVHEVLRRRAQGFSCEEAAHWAREHAQNICHYFTVDDLHFLHRGGRVSKATAVVGTVLGIKPLLHVNEQGQLINIGKVRGRRASLDWLVDRMAAKLAGGMTDRTVFIGHGDCLEDARYVAGLVKKRFDIGDEDIYIDYIGPVIGSHSGPGTVALFFVGPDRSEGGK